jgi:hypothetical protein
MDSETFSRACRLVRAEASVAFAGLVHRGFGLPEQTGFYPRVRAEREEPWLLGIDFWMTLDEGGDYRTEWSREAPFELGAAAAITRQEGPDLIRYWKRYVLYASRPYDVALRVLATDVIAVAEVIESWTEQTIVGTGERVAIRQTSRAR